MAGGQNNDDYNDDGFIGYVPDTVDPGPWILIGTIIICICTIIALPILLILWERRVKRKGRLDSQFALIDATSTPDVHGVGQDHRTNEFNETHDVNETWNNDNKKGSMASFKSRSSAALEQTSNRYNDYRSGKFSDVSSSTGSGLVKLAKVTDRINQTVDELTGVESSPSYYGNRKRLKTQRSRSDGRSVGSKSVDSSASSIRSNYSQIRPFGRHGRRSSRLSSRSYGIHKAIYKETREDRIGDEEIEIVANQLGAEISSSKYASSIFSGTNFVSEMYPEDAVDALDPGKEDNSLIKDDKSIEYDICCGPNLFWMSPALSRSINNVIDLAEYDEESKRIVKLAIPMTLSEVLFAAYENVELILVAKCLSTNALTAWAISGLFMEITETFFEGIPDALNTVTSHAIGGGNFYLAGQYTQMAILLYTVSSVFGYGFWYFYMDKAILLLGLSENTAQLALDYTRVFIFPGIVGGIYESTFALLDVTGHEDFVAVIYIVSGAIETVTIAIFLIYLDGDLRTTAWIDLVFEVIVFFITVFYVWKKSWYKRFIRGLFYNFSLKNVNALKTLMQTSWPLMLGQVVAYGEWELLTVFCAHLGEAEVAAWAILGELWDLFEAATEGIGEAAAIRIAHHLGNGNHRMAKISCYKSSLFGMIIAFFVTAFFYICGDDIAIWFTNDPTLQQFMTDLLPYVGIGNLTLTFGMLAWNQLGGQGRYRIATLIHLFCSLAITLPLAAVSVYIFRFSLEGVVAAVVIGFAFAALIMAFVLLISDWERLSVIIRELNAIEYADDSSSSDESSSDESISSSESNES